MANATVVYYLDVLSSWCLVAEEALQRVRDEFGSQVEVEWRIAALRDPLGYTPEQLAYYYRRTLSISGMKLNPVWLQSVNDGSRYANLAAEAARKLGDTDDCVRLALARAAMISGKHVAQREVAVDIAAEAGRLDRKKLETAMDDPETAAKIRATSAEFAELKVEMRPTFVLQSAIRDKTVLSGCWRYETLAACVKALIDDHAAFASFVTANPPPPGAT